MSEVLYDVLSSVEIIVKEGAEIPQRATDGSAGYDLRAFIPGEEGEQYLYLFEDSTPTLIQTGISIHIKDPNYVAKIYPRGGSHGTGIVLGNTVGIIDSDYQGEILISAWLRPDASESLAASRRTIRHGDRIAQLVFERVYHPRFVQVEEFSGKTARGEGRHHSTGIR